MLPGAALAIGLIIFGAMNEIYPFAHFSLSAQSFSSVGRCLFLLTLFVLAISVGSVGVASEK